MPANVSEEMINAYIDNELDKKDTQLINVQMKNDPALQRKVEKLQALKLKIRSSYASVHSPVRKQSTINCRKYLIPAGIAASVALVVGLTTGWYSHDYMTITKTDSNNLLGVKLEDLKPQVNKIIIHLAKNDIDLFDKALTKAETLLANFDTQHQQGQVHILANSYGMDLLRRDKSPYQKRIMQMMQRYDNVEFVACENTIKRLTSSGKTIDLLPGVKVHGPVINQIISSLQNGWSYISI